MLCKTAQPFRYIPDHFARGTEAKRGEGRGRVMADVDRYIVAGRRVGQQYRTSLRGMVIERSNQTCPGNAMRICIELHCKLIRRRALTRD
jgi:hypothetical protein